MTSCNEFGRLTKVAMRRPANAFVSDEKIDREWRDLNYHARPDLANAEREYKAFVAHLENLGTEVVELPHSDDLTLDSLYTRDSLIVTPKGLVKPRMGKAQRRPESRVNAEALEPHMPVLGEITGDGKVEGGDLVWLDEKTLLAGIGYRTNENGIAQLRQLMGQGVTVHTFDLPHYKGRSDVFHLMSVLSPVDHDLAVVFLPLMPVRLVEFLESRKMSFIEVPDLEFPTMACNVLAIAPRHAIMVEGNPDTEGRIRAAGVKLEVIAATDISRKGEGGPTCMTRPLIRG
jgi:N-dimethylarginine dimethylaminohydrolase